jgi:hypothetical protein
LGGRGEKGGEKLKSQVLKGVKNSMGKGCKVTRKMFRPVTVGTLWKLRQTLKAKKGSRVTRQGIWAAALTAFWGCFRLGELLSRRKLSFDKFTDLTWQDVQIHKNLVRFEIKSGKTSNSEPIFVNLGTLPERRLCPRRAIKRLRTLQKKKKMFAQDLPVFRKGSGENLRPVDLVRSLGRLEGSGGRYSAKSFRAGVPTILAQNKGCFGALELKHFGRWKSTAFRSYIEGGPGSLDLYHQITDFVLTCDPYRPACEEETG